MSPAQQAFLAAYRKSGSVAKAARAAKIQRQMHYRWLDEISDDAILYRAEFQQAHKEAMQTRLDDAEQRADRIRLLEIGTKEKRTRVIQERWNFVSARLLRIVEERGADLSDVPGGKSGFLCRDAKGMSGVLVYKIDGGIVQLLAELRQIERHMAEQTGQLVHRNEHSGPDGGPIAIDPRCAQLTDDELDFAAGLARKLAAAGSPGSGEEPPEEK